MRVVSLSALFILLGALAACEPPLPPLPPAVEPDDTPAPPTPFGIYALTSVGSGGLPRELQNSPGVEAGATLVADSVLLSPSGSLSGEALVRRADSSTFTIQYTGSYIVSGSAVSITVNGMQSSAELLPFLPTHYNLRWQRWEGETNYYWYQIQ